MQIKNYLLTILENVADNNFGQDAVEYAIFNDWITLTYQLEADLAMIMRQYDQLIEAYQRVCREHLAANLMNELTSMMANEPLPLVAG